MFGAIDALEIHPRRRWTAAVSFTLQAAAVAAALVIPVLYPNTLPEAFAHRRIFVPASQPGEPIPAGDVRSPSGRGPTIGVRPIVVNQDNGVHYGRPREYSAISDGPPVPPAYPGVENSTGTNAINIPAPDIHPVLNHRPPISVMMQGNLIHRVEPVYPSIARSVGMQGPVVIRAMISATGNIEQAQVISGSPLLVQAALEAIRQWKYRPYYLNNRPVEVETEITVNFVLQR